MEPQTLKMTLFILVVWSTLNIAILGAWHSTEYIYIYIFFIIIRTITRIALELGFHKGGKIVKPQTPKTKIFSGTSDWNYTPGHAPQKRDALRSIRGAGDTKGSKICEDT